MLSKTHDISVSELSEIGYAIDGIHAFIRTYSALFHLCETVEKYPSLFAAGAFEIYRKAPRRTDREAARAFLNVAATLEIDLAKEAKEGAIHPDGWAFDADEEEKINGRFIEDWMRLFRKQGLTDHYHPHFSVIPDAWRVCPESDAEELPSIDILEVCASNRLMPEKLAAYGGDADIAWGQLYFLNVFEEFVGDGVNHGRVVEHEIMVAHSLVAYHEMHGLKFWTEYGKYLKPAERISRQ